MAANRGLYRFMIFLTIVAAGAGANYVQVDFTKTLHVNTLTSKTYTDFLKELRKVLGKTYSKSVPVLPVYDEKNPRGFDLVLTAGTTTTTARFRSDNLYLVGFQMQTGKKTWYEFGYKKDERPRLIEGSEFLEFDETYTDLQLKGDKVTDMVINQKELVAAVGNLAGSQNKRQRATAVIVVVQMISEAARFLDISSHFASNLDNKKAKLPPWMFKDLEKNWADLSDEVLKSDAYPCYKFTPPTINKKKIKTVEALRGYFGILYRDPDTLKPPCKSLYDDMKSLSEFEARRFGPMMVAQA